MALYTQNAERRPDLEALEVNPPENYIGGLIVPAMTVSQKAGKIYYQAVVAAQTAQTGRVAGVAPESFRIASSSTDWSTAEAVKTAKIATDEVPTYGSIEEADKLGGGEAKRTVMAKMEADVRDMIFDDTPATTLDVTGLRVQFQNEGIQETRRYPGKSVLVGATTTLKSLVTAIIEDDRLSVPFARIVTGTDSKSAVMGLGFDAWKAGLAMYIGVDEVLAGDDAIWNESGSDAEGALALVKVPVSVTPFTHKTVPIFGRVLVYLPADGGGQEFYIQSAANMQTLDNEYTARAWYDPLTLNSGAKVTWTLVAASGS